MGMLEPMTQSEVKELCEKHEEKMFKKKTRRHFEKP
jgi:hypothetical protein